MLNKASLDFIEQLLEQLNAVLICFKADLALAIEPELSRWMMTCDIIQHFALEGCLTSLQVQRVLNCLIELMEICLSIKKLPFDASSLLNTAKDLAENESLNRTQVRLLTLGVGLAKPGIIVNKDVMCSLQEKQKLIEWYKEWANVKRELEDLQRAHQLTTNSSEKKQQADLLHQAEKNYISFVRERLNYPYLFESLLHKCNKQRKLSLDGFKKEFSIVTNRITQLLSQGRSLIALQLLHTVHRDYLTKSSRCAVGVAEDLRDFDLNQLVLCLQEIYQAWDHPYQGDWEVYQFGLADLRKQIRQEFEGGSAPVNVVQRNITEGFHQLFKDMLTQSQELLGEPPCSFALAASGSFGRQEMMLNSDLEYMVLVADSVLRDSEYFTVFLNLFRFKVASLGEMTAKAVGFHLDEGVALLDSPLRNTPSNVAKAMFDERFYPVEDTGGQTIAFSMLRPRLLYGDPSLLVNYEEEIKCHCAESRTKAISFLKGKVTEFESRKLSDTRHLKYGYGNYLIHPLLILGIYYDIKEADTFSILRQLSERNIFDKAFIRFYEESLKALSTLRLKSQLYYLKKGKFEEEVRFSSQSKEGYYCLTEAEETSLKILDQVLLPLFYSLLSKLINNFTDDMKLKENIDPAFEYLQQVLRKYQENTPSSVAQEHLHKVFMVITDYLACLERVDRLKHQAYYECISTELRGPYLEALRRSFKIQRLHQRKEQEIDDLLGFLAAIPNAVGYRESERLAYQQLDLALKAVTVDESSLASNVTAWISWSLQDNTIIKQRLRQEFIPKLLDLSSPHFKLHHTYKESMHDVVRLDAEGFSLHIKSYPNQPMLDYAMDILHRRLVGQGTPANVLARLTIHDNINHREVFYPVLVSQTVGEKNLRDILMVSPEFANIDLDKTCYTQLVLMSLLTLPGDRADRNVVGCQKEGMPMQLFSPDNEQQFVEPVIKKTFTTHVQFCDILFCLPQADQPLDRLALEAFTHINNIDDVIREWVRALEIRQGLHHQLFSIEEQQLLYGNIEKENLSVLSLLLSPGVLGTLVIHLHYLQNVIRFSLSQLTQQLPNALMLLKQLYPGVAHYYQEAFTHSNKPKERFKKATGAKGYSVSSRLSIQASLGVVPTFEGMPKYSLYLAKNELVTLLDFKPNFSLLVDATGQPDLPRQLKVLMALVIRPHASLDLSHCAALTDDNLKIILNKSHAHLKKINLRSCPNLTDKAVVYLADKHPELTHLYLSDNLGLKK